MHLFYTFFLICFIRTEWPLSAPAASLSFQFTSQPQPQSRPSRSWLNVPISSGNQRKLSSTDLQHVSWCYSFIMLLCHLNYAVHSILYSDLLKSPKHGISQMASILQTSSHSSIISIPLHQSLEGDTQIYVYFPLLSSCFHDPLKPEATASFFNWYVISYLCQITVVFVSSALKVKGLSSLNSGKSSEIQATTPRFL